MPRPANHNRNGGKNRQFHHRSVGTKTGGVRVPRPSPAQVNVTSRNKNRQQRTTGPELEFKFRFLSGRSGWSKRSLRLLSNVNLSREAHILWDFAADAKLVPRRHSDYDDGQGKKEAERKYRRLTRRIDEALERGLLAPERLTLLEDDLGSLWIHDRKSRWQMGRDQALLRLHAHKDTILLSPVSLGLGGPGNTQHFVTAVAKIELDHPHPHDHPRPNYGTKLIVARASLQRLIYHVNDDVKHSHPASFPELAEFEGRGLQSLLLFWDSQESRYATDDGRWALDRKLTRLLLLVRRRALPTSSVALIVVQYLIGAKVDDNAKINIITNTLPLPPTAATPPPPPTPSNPNISNPTTPPTLRTFNPNSIDVNNTSSAFASKRYNDANPFVTPKHRHEQSGCVLL